MTQVVAPRSTRLLSLAGVVAGATAESLLIPGGARRRQRLQICTAARVPTALTAHDAGRLGDLALLTSAPRSLAGWGELADRVVPVPGPRTPPPAGGSVVRPVTGTCGAAAGGLPRTVGLCPQVWAEADGAGTRPEVAATADTADQLGGAGTGGSTITPVGGSTDAAGGTAEVAAA